MPRSIWKGPFVDPSVFRLVEKAKDKKGKNAVINIRSRGSYILPDFVGLTFGVYNGKTFVPVQVSERMIGRKFGEFSPTRTYYGHGVDKKLKKK